jgi:hypothetical protein
MLPSKRCCCNLINHPKAVSHMLPGSLPVVSESDSGVCQVQPKDVEQIEYSVRLIRRNKMT